MFPSLFTISFKQYTFNNDKASLHDSSPTKSRDYHAQPYIYTPTSAQESVVQRSLLSPYIIHFPLPPPIIPGPELVNFENSNLTRDYPYQPYQPFHAIQWIPDDGPQRESNFQPALPQLMGQDYIPSFFQSVFTAPQRESNDREAQFNAYSYTKYARAYPVQRVPSLLVQPFTGFDMSFSKRASENGFMGLPPAPDSLFDAFQALDDTIQRYWNISPDQLSSVLEERTYDPFMSKRAYPFMRHGFTVADWSAPQRESENSYMGRVPPPHSLFPPTQDSDKRVARIITNQQNYPVFHSKQKQVFDEDATEVESQRTSDDIYSLLYI